MAVAGEIRIDTTVDKSGAERDLKELQGSFAKFGKAIAASLNDAMQGAQSAFDGLRGKISDSAAAFEGLAESVAAAAQAVDFEPLGNSLDGITEKLAEQQAAHGEAAGAAAEASSEQADGYQELARQIRELGSEIAEKVGKTVQDVFSSFAAGAKKAVGAIAGLVGKLKLFERVSAMVKKAAEGMKKAFAKVGEVLSKGLTSALKAAVSAFKEGMGNLAGSSTEAGRAISGLKAETASMKNNLAAAFAPIISAVVPMLSTLVGWINSAISAMGQLIAAMSGKSSYTRAVKQQQAYTGAVGGSSAALGDMADAAEEADKAIHKLSIDELNTFSDDKGASSSSGSGGGGGGGGGAIAGDLFEEVPVDDWLKSLDAYELGKLVGDKLAAALDSIPWDKIQAKAVEIGRRLGEFLNGVVDSDLFNAMGRTIGEGINTVFMLAEELIDTFKFGNFGSQLSSGLMWAVETVDWDLVGRTFGKGITGWRETVYRFFKDTDWTLVGDRVGSGLNSAIYNTDWDLVGRSFGVKWNALVDALDGFIQRTDWKELGLGIATSVNGWFNEIDWGKAGRTLSDGVRGIFDTVKTAIAEIDWVAIGHSVWEFLAAIDWTGIIADLAYLLGQAIAGIAALLWGFIQDAVFAVRDYFAEKFEESGGNIIEGLLKGILDAIAGIARWIWDNIFVPIWEGITSVFGIHSPSTVMAELGGFLIEGLANGIRDFLDLVIEVFTGLWESIREAAELAWDWVVGVWEIAATWFDEKVIKLVKEFFTGLWDDIKEKAGDAWDWVVGIFDWAAEWFNTWVTEPIQEFFDGLWGGIKDGAQGLWDKVVEIFGKIAGWVKRFFVKPIEDAFSDVGEKINDVFEGIREFVKGIINSILGFINGMMAAIAKGVNAVIDILNTLSWDIPDWVPVIGGKTFGFNIPNVTAPQIPLLAKGAVIPPNREFLAVLGDQRSGTNIEAPLSTIEDAVRRVMSEDGGRVADIVAALRQLGIDADALRVSLQVDSREIARAAGKGKSKLGQSYGGPAFAYAR